MTSSAPPSDVCENAAWCTAPTPITIKNFSSSIDVLHNSNGAPATANAGPNEEETDEPETEEVEADVGGFVEEKRVERDLVGWEGNEDGYEP